MSLLLYSKSNLCHPWFNFNPYQMSSAQKNQSLTRCRVISLIQKKILFHYIDCFWGWSPLTGTFNCGSVLRLTVAKPFVIKLKKRKEQRLGGIRKFQNLIRAPLICAEKNFSFILIQRNNWGNENCISSKMASGLTHRNHKTVWWSAILKLFFLYSVPSNLLNFFNAYSLVFFFCSSVHYSFSPIRLKIKLLNCLFLRLLSQNLLCQYPSEFCFSVYFLFVSSFYSSSLVTVFYSTFFSLVITSC